MNKLVLQFKIPKAGSDDSSFFGEFFIRVDDHEWGSEEFLYSDSSLSVPTTEPVALSIDDRVCIEGCCPGLWATAFRDGDVVIWTDFRSIDPQPTDPPPETTYIFPIAEYEAQIESARATLAEIKYLRSCPDFDALTERLHSRLTLLDYPLPVEWLMEKDSIRDSSTSWIRCREAPGDIRPARLRYERLRKECRDIKIILARHPGYPRTLALLNGGDAVPRPSLQFRLVPSLPGSGVGRPVRSPLLWAYLRFRFGINRGPAGANFH